MPNSSKPNTLNSPSNITSLDIARALIARHTTIDDSRDRCFDCLVSLDMRDDWEPFVYRGRHVKICADCIETCTQNPPCLLAYSDYRNREVQSPLFSDTVIDPTAPLGYRPRVETDIEPDDCPE